MGDVVLEGDGDVAGRFGGLAQVDGDKSGDDHLAQDSALGCVLVGGGAAAAAQTEAADKIMMYYLLGASYNAKEMKDQAIAAFRKVTDGAAAENAKAALTELTK